MSTIRNTVLDTLRSNGYGSYSRIAEPVIVALEANAGSATPRPVETVITETLRNNGMSQYVSYSGMVVRALAALDTTTPATSDEADEAFPTIAALIEDTLREQGITNTAQYRRYIDAVASALQERVFEIADALVAEGVDLGADEAQVRDIVEKVGLSFRPEPEVVAEPVAEGGEPTLADVLREVQTIAARMNAIEAAAARHGVRVS